MAKNTNAVEVVANVESAEYKATSTLGLMLTIVLMAHFSKTSAQKIWDNLMIEDASLQALSYGRRKAKELAVACGLEKRPSEDDVSKLVGHEVLVRLTVDDDGDFKILGYKPLLETEPKPVGGELTF